jgi:hypothetical protein
VDSGDEIVEPVASGMSLDEASGDAGIARYWGGPISPAGALRYTVRVVPRHPLLATQRGRWPGGLARGAGRG